MSHGSDGIHGDDIDRGSRRDRDRRGGDRDENDLKDYVVRIYREYKALYDMVKEETDCIRRHPGMRYSSRAVRELDVGDAILRRTLDEGSPLQMLRQFYDNCGQVKDCLNKQFRQQFFRVMRSGGGDRGDSSSRRRESSRDDGRTRDRDERSSRYRDEKDSYRDSRDRDRRDDKGEKGRSDRRDEDKGRSDRRDDDKGRDRYDDRKRERRSDDKYSSRDRSDRYSSEKRRY